MPGRMCLWPVCVGLLCAALAAPGRAQDDSMGCGPKKEKFRVTRHKDDRPMAEPSEGKALIYVLKGFGKIGREGAYRLGVNGKWVGANTKNTYYFSQSDPGLLRMCAEGAWKKGLQFLTVEPGKTYYLYLNVGMVVWNEGILEMHELVAKGFLGKYQYITYEVKR